MSSTMPRAALVLLALSASSPAAAQGAARVSSVSWLAGCLEMRRGDRVVEEQRMPDRAGTMVGMGRSVGPRGLYDYELTVIQEEGSRLLYVAHPRRQPVATFVASVATADSVVFENAQHDFPQRVGYRRVGADSVLAWIDGTSNGKKQRVEFPYRRVPCPAAP
jgi:Domain of unknown function (DUF6265)